MERYKSFGADAPTCILLCLFLIHAAEASPASCPCPRGPICGTRVTGDFNWDQRVDYEDLRHLAIYWLNGPGSGQQPGDGPDPNLYDEQLQWLIYDARQPIVPFQFYTPPGGTNVPGPRFYPMPELSTPDAMPFLVDVLLNGPNWSDEGLLTAYGGIGPHVARCYAALCLGAIGDPRALEPLIETLEHGDTMEDKYTITYPRKDEHDIRSYAAFALGQLGDCRAVEPLTAALRRDRWSMCVYSLARLRAFHSISTMLQVSSEEGYFCGEIHRALQYMLSTDFRVIQGQTGYVVDAFPELGELDAGEVYEKLWLHWLEVGSEYARRQFETYYALRKAAIEEFPLATARHDYLQTAMLQGGVAAMPYLMEKMQEGDDSLVPALVQLTRSYQDTAHCSTSDCIQWWKEHQQEWLIFEHPPMPGCRRVPADYPTIQAAVDDANDGDTVFVAPGTYTGDGNRDIDFKSKGITVKSEQGPESCIIDCGGPYPAYVYWPGPREGSGRRGGDPELHDYHRAFCFHSHQAVNSLVQGFTVTGGVAMDTAWNMDNGGAFHCTDSRLTIRDCIIMSNAARLGGGIYARDSQILIDNSVITENKAYDDSTIGGEGGGAWIYGGEVCFSNCRVIGNVASGGGGGVSCQGNHRFVNCVITGNRANPYGRGGGILFGPGREQDTSYVLNSIVWGNTDYITLVAFAADDVAINSGVMLGTMNAKAAHSLIGADSTSVDDRMIGQWLNGDPLFAACGRWDPNGTPDNPNDDFWVNGDYHLKSQAGRWDPESETWLQDDVTSPCIDAGDPMSPIGLEPFPNGGRVNMGAYGGTAEASKSYFGEPLCETVIAGDINGDCRVDWEDFRILALHWMAAAPVPPAPQDGEDEPISSR